MSMRTPHRRVLPCVQADEKIALMQERVSKARSTIDTSAPRGWAEKHSAEGVSSPSKAKVAARERAELIALDNMLLARRIFNIMEAPSAISEIINDTRHLDVHPGTMNYKHRVVEAEIVHRDNLIIADRLQKIKPYYGYSDLNANRGMLEHRHKARKAAKPKKAAAKPAEAPPPGGSRSARGAPRSQNQHAPPSGSQSARGAAKHVVPKGVLLRSFKVQDGARIELIVVKEPQRDSFGVLGKCGASGALYEAAFSSEQVSTLVDGDLLVTNIEKPEVWEVLFKKVQLAAVGAFSALYSAVSAEVVLDSAIAKLAAAPASSSSASSSSSAKSPSKPKGNRPTSRNGGRAGKAKTDAKKANGGVLTEAPTAEQGIVAQESGDSAEAHGAATKLQALQRAKKAKQEAARLREHKKAAAGPENRHTHGQEKHEPHDAAAEEKRIAQEIGDSAEVHGAASKLQAAQRARKAKAEVQKLRKERQEKHEHEHAPHAALVGSPGAAQLVQGAEAAPGAPPALAQARKSPQPKAPTAPRQGNGGRAPQKAK